MVDLLKNDWNLRYENKERRSVRQHTEPRVPEKSGICQIGTSRMCLCVLCVLTHRLGLFAGANMTTSNVIPLTRRQWCYPNPDPVFFASTMMRTLA